MYTNKLINYLLLICEDKYLWSMVNNVNVHERGRKIANDRYKDMMNEAREKVKRTSQPNNLVD